MAGELTVKGRYGIPSVARAAEGSFSPGPYSLIGGLLPAGSPWNWWQTGANLWPTDRSAVVQACVGAYAQTMAMCPGTHWLKNDKGGRDRVTTSALSRILKRPNGYQSISDFFLNLTDGLYSEGNAYALGLRNDRNEISSLHLFDPRASTARIATTGDIFYSLAGNPIVENALGGGLDSPLRLVPARDVLHLRMNYKRHPLEGLPPLTSALLDVSASNAMLSRTLAFALNQSRPSGILATDKHLNKEQANEARARWNEHTKDLNIGGTPILSDGLKWQAIAFNSRDSQMAEILQISDQRIATAYRVPLAILSLTSGQGPQASTESLMGFWVATGFGFACNHVEEGVGNFFGLKGWPDEYLELDTQALLRSNQKDRIEALARGVQGGIYAPNEARNAEDLPSVEFGDEPRVQQQVVPLSFASEPPPPPAAPPAPAATEPDPDADPPEGENNAAAEWSRRIRDAAERFDSNRAA